MNEWDIEVRENNEKPVVRKLISLLSPVRGFTSPVDNIIYIVKRRLMGKSGFFERCCGSRTLVIKEFKYKEGDEDAESVLGCTYYFCEKCGHHSYDDGHNTF